MNRVTDTDRGMNALLARMKQRATVTVGVLDPSTPHGRSTVGQVAAATEFGAPAAGIPQQSFLRAGIDAHEQDLRALELEGAQRVIAGTGTAQQAIERVGAAAVAAVRERVPVDTGQLRDAIVAEVSR